MNPRQLELSVVLPLPLPLLPAAAAAVFTLHYLQYLRCQTSLKECPYSAVAKSVCSHPEGPRFKAQFFLIESLDFYMEIIDKERVLWRSSQCRAVGQSLPFVRTSSCY